MPIFDFLCSDCTHVFEFTRAFGSKELPNCSKCGSSKTTKQLSTPNIAFKGSGFYVTDNAAKPKNATAAPKHVDKVETKSN
jgi:putative FmdB family regulatory protein